MNVRPMRGFEEQDVRLIYHLCHPGWPKKPPRWHEAHPTLVLEHERAIVGWTAYSVSLVPSCVHVPTEGEVMYGHGVHVAPEHRGHGYGRLLADARLDVARVLRVPTFIGMTTPDNLSMIRILQAQGMKPLAEAPNAYPDGSTGVVYVGSVI